MAAALVLQFVAVLLLTGLNFGSLVFALPIMLPAIVFIVLALTKGKPWMFLAAGITSVLFPLLILAFVPNYIVTPQLGPAFSGAVFALLSVVLALPAGVWVYRHRAEGLPAMTVRDGVRTRHGILTVLVVGMCLGAVATGEAAYLYAAAAGQAPVANFSPDVRITLTTENFLFVPTTLNIPAGELVEVTIVNKDAAWHTFTYTVGAGTPDEETFNHDILPSATSRVLVLIETPGEIPFVCTPHKDMGMVGTLVVT